MLQVTITDTAALTAFWLVFTRWLAVMLQLPLFDNASVPPQVKVLCALMISYAFYPQVSAPVMRDMAVIGADNFWYLTILNTMIGLLIGFLAKSIMDIFVSAGGMITQQIGLGAVRYFDPQSSTQIGPFEMMIQWSMLIIIISSGALLPMFKGVLNTFHSIGLSDLTRLHQTPEFFLEAFKSIFVSGLALAAPLIFLNMLIMAILGIIARTVPQMNVLMVSFAVNIGLGLLVFLATTDEFYGVAYDMYIQKLGDWFQFVS
jgi:flagellar biosynthesis protein FliR